MNKFLKNIFYFSIPFGVYLLIIYYVDPFNYNNNYNRIDFSVKKSISYQIEPHLFKLIEFDNQPKKNIALGDSRTHALFPYLDQNRWIDMAYDGGSLKEIIETIWYVIEREDPDTLLVSLNMRMYNKYHKRSWIQETIERKKNFFSYAFSKYSFNSTYHILKFELFKEEYQRKRRDMSKEEFWKYELNVTAKKFFEKHSHPDEYLDELKKIVNYCNDHNVKVIFWIPPTHVDFQAKIKEFNLKHDEDVFKAEIDGLTKTYDFNYINSITKDSSNFTDPIHYNSEVGKLIYQAIFKNVDSFKN